MTLTYLQIHHMSYPECHYPWDTGKLRWSFSVWTLQPSRARSRVRLFVLWRENHPMVKSTGFDWHTLAYQTEHVASQYTIWLSGDPASRIELAEGVEWCGRLILTHISFACLFGSETWPEDDIMISTCSEIGSFQTRLLGTTVGLRMG